MKILSSLVISLFELLPEDIIKKALTDFLNSIEKRIKDSPPLVDDVIVLPIIGLIRKSLNISSLPGDYNNRVRYYKEGAINRGIDLTEQDILTLEKYIIEQGIWQAKVDTYLNNLVRKDS